MNGVAHLQRVLSTRSIDQDAGEWIVDALVRYSCADGPPLEAAFGLDRASRLKHRNAALCEAGQLLRLPDDDGYLWPVAKRLSAAIKHRERMRRAPQTPVEQAIARAFLAGLDVPGTPRQLYEILR